MNRQLERQLFVRESLKPPVPFADTFSIFPFHLKMFGVTVSNNGPHHVDLVKSIPAGLLQYLITPDFFVGILDVTDISYF